MVDGRRTGQPARGGGGTRVAGGVPLARALPMQGGACVAWVFFAASPRTLPSDLAWNASFPPAIQKK